MVFVLVAAVCVGIFVLSCFSVGVGFCLLVLSSVFAKNARATTIASKLIAPISQRLNHCLNWLNRDVFVVDDVVDVFFVVFSGLLVLLPETLLVSGSSWS